jgi:hypothetical protein
VDEVRDELQVGSLDDEAKRMTAGRPGPVVRDPQGSWLLDLR